MDADQKKPVAHDGEPDQGALEVELLLEAIFQKFQYDFRGYSRASIRRRLEQALVRFGCASISQLQSRVLHEPTFFPALLGYLTVPTTEMFRDPVYFHHLGQHVLPMLATFPSLKVWVAGSSTGEEVYSLAILFREHGLFDKTIFYATDINPNSLAKARAGIFELEAVQKGSVNYRKAGGKGSLSDHYTTAAYDAVQFDRGLVANAVFSDHSLATDSVFAEVHLVSCRNVLIYFNRPLQDRAVGLFCDSLVRGGYLGLGSKETLHFSEHRHHFQRLLPDEQLYRRT